ncbi:MAG: ribose-phosphate pyrophosphokinase [Candidatus Woesearchaeota archaeon]
MKLISGTSNIPLAQEIAKELEMELTPCTIKRFADGEIYAHIDENVRGENIFIIQALGPPINDNIMELLILLDAAKRASAGKITCVIPYYGYGRQDRKVRAREPISAKLVANLLTTAGAQSILTVDLHANQIQGYFDIPVDDIWAASTLASYFQELKISDLVVVSPDAGGVARARYFGKKLDAPIALIDKRRETHNESEVMHVVGDIEGKNAIIIDDIIDTAGTITKACAAIKKRGAKAVYLVATHGLFNGNAYVNIENSNAEEVVVTNTLTLPESAPSKIRVISIGPLVAMAIKHSYEGGSLSTLLERKFAAKTVKR